ncbi:hypothetical protein JD844_028085, partial [Phrynosoma platyrhinos]
PFKVLATETINQKALDADIYNAVPTEKVDGTCCYITTYKGQPYLWARLDRKPNKQAEKRFKRFLYSTDNSQGFTWSVEEDFRPVPECWIPAKETEHCNGKPLPDENGHIPGKKVCFIFIGWVPVEKNSKQYCWHTSVVNYEFELALILRHHTEEPGLLEISPVPLSSFSEHTLELIGTNINANPYGKYTLCLHRHHLGLSWPIADPHLISQPVVVNFSMVKYDYNFEPKTLFDYFSKLDGQRFCSLRDITGDL